MPETNTPQPNAPLLRDGGYASQALSGYLQQFDLVEENRGIGRWPGAGVGPFQWIRYGTGLELSSDGELNCTITPGGDGDVVGPAASTDGFVAVWNGVTGKLLKDSLISAAWFNQALLTGSTPTFAGAVLGTLSVNGFAFTVSGTPTLGNWFDQSVKTGASPTFNGLTLTSLTVNTFGVTVNGAVTLNNWFDQSVKTTAAPTFDGVTVTNGLTADTLDAVSDIEAPLFIAAGDPGVTAGPFDLALDGGGHVTISVKGGLVIGLS